MDWRKYYGKLKERLAAGHSYKRLLLLSWERKPGQAILLNKEGEVYGVEEAFSLLTESERNWREALEGVPVAICLEGLYQEEFTLPKLSAKELKGMIQEEVKLRLPFTEGSYSYGYQLLSGKEELTVRLVALEKEMLKELESFVSGFKGKLVWVGGSAFLEQEELEKTEFWNCFCDKEKQQELEREYKELLRFGQGCFRNRGVVNLLQPAFWWEEEQGRRKAAAYIGFGFLGFSILMLPLLGLQNYQLKQERKVVEHRLKELAPWQSQRSRLIKLQQQVKQKENIAKQLKLAPAQGAKVMELLGRITPAGCWLTSIEEKEQNMLLKGKALNSSGVELLRKQLLVIGNCQACELVACQSTPEEEVSFILKLTL